MQTKTLNIFQTAYVNAVAAYQTVKAMYLTEMGNDSYYQAIKKKALSRGAEKLDSSSFEKLIKEMSDIEIAVESRLKIDDFRFILRESEEILVNEFVKEILAIEQINHTKTGTENINKYSEVKELFSNPEMLKKVMFNLKHRQNLINIIMKYKWEPYATV